MPSDPVELSLWCRGTLRVSVEGLGQRDRVTTTQPFARCGRLDTCDVRLTAPGIPRRLLYLHATPQGLFALPLVELGRFAPLPSGWLVPGVPARVGPYRVNWQWECHLPGGAALLSDPSKLGSLVEKGSAKQRWELDIYVDGHRVGRYELSRVLTLVGRHPPSHLMMTSRSVSGCHCVIVAEENQLWVVDLCSANGIQLDGRAALAGWWPAGVPLQLGRVTLVAKPMPSPVPIGTALAKAGTSAKSFQQPSSQVTSEPTRPIQPADIETRSEPGRSASHPLPPDAGSLQEIPRADNSTGETLPTVFTPSSRVKNGAFALEGPASMDQPLEKEPGEPLALSKPAIFTDSGETTGLPEVIPDSQRPSGATPFDNLVVHQEFVDAEYPPVFVDTEITVEECMPENRLTAQAKDYVLCLFADESVDDHCLSVSSEKSELPHESTDRLEPHVAGDGFPRKDAPHGQLTDAAAIEQKTQELLLKEQLLIAWAKTLDQMSEAILHLQEDLVAEEDRFAEQQQLLAEQEKQLIVRQREIDARAEQLAILEQTLLQRERELEAREKALKEDREALVRDTHNLAEERQTIERLRKEQQGRAEELVALHTSLAQREQEVREKQQLLAEHEASLKQKAEQLSEETRRLAALEQELKCRTDALNAKEQDLFRRESEQREAAIRFADLELRLSQQQQMLLHLEQELESRKDELTRLEQGLLRQQKELSIRQQALSEQEQLLSSRCQELANLASHLAEKEREIATQASNLARWEQNLQEWERDVKDRASRLPVVAPTEGAAESEIATQTTGNEQELATPQRVESEVVEAQPAEGISGAEGFSSVTAESSVAELPGAVLATSIAPRVEIDRLREEDWPVIPLAKIHRRWRAPAPIAIGLVIAGLVACSVWWFCPREFITACRIEFPEDSPLLYVRDGTRPRGVVEEFFPSMPAVAANDPRVVTRLGQIPEIPTLLTNGEKTWDQVLASAKVSRSEGLPFTTMVITTRDPTKTQQAIERWGNVYLAMLAESFQEKVSPALAKAKQRWQITSQQLKEHQASINDLKQRYQVEHPRQLELQAHESLHMAEVTQKEIDQLQAEITAQKQRLEQVKAVADRPEQAISEEEVMAAVAERLAQDGLTVETSDPGADAVNPDPGIADEAEANSQQPPDGSNAPRLNAPDPGSRYEIVRQLVRKELSERKRQDAVLTVQVLTAELDRLQARLQKAMEQKAQYEATAGALLEAAKQWNNLEVETAKLENEHQQLTTQIDILEKALAQSRIAPHLEIWSSQQRPWMPFAAAALAGGGAMIPFGLWGLLRSLRTVRVFPPAAIGYQSKYPHPTPD